jgi:hypothetical protein
MHAVAHRVELDLDREQPLLRTVVQIPLQSQPFALRRLGDSPARSLEVLDRRDMRE